MKIVLGSTSEDKKNILMDFLNKSDISSEVVAQNVQSGITDQPLEENMIIKGAVNRSKQALANVPDADLSVGMEGGLNKVADKGYFMVCVAAIYTKDGELFLGISSKLQLPKFVSDEVKKGRQFGETIRNYKLLNDNDKNIEELIVELISRKKSFNEALNNAFLAITNKRHFFDKT
jgi:inosine/xanthosine triphosphatase